MHQLPLPLLKLFSYFAEIKVAEAQSEVSDKLEVFLDSGRFKLNSGNATYSFEDRYVVYHAGLRHIKKELVNFEKVLLLGYGLGSIPLLLEKLQPKQYDITAVELDPAVIQLAKKYGYSKDVRFVESDAFDFVNGSTDHYDLICMDVFEQELIPHKFLDRNFLQLAKNRLRQNGILLYNFYAYPKSIREMGELFLEQDVKTVFPDSEIVETSYNFIFCCRKVAR